jgi:adenosylhomocysteine nucleosidase
MGIEPDRNPFTEVCAAIEQELRAFNRTGMPSAFPGGMKAFIVLVFLVPLAVFADFGPRSFEGPGFTAIVAAYRPETEAILKLIEEHPDASIEKTMRFRGVTYHLGTYESMPILVFETGISIANAAMTTQMAIDYFPIETLYFAGIAGGVNQELAKGDVTIPGKWAYHDESAYFNPSGEGESHIVADYYRNSAWFYPENRPAGMDIPDYNNFDLIYPDEVSIIKDEWDRPRPYAWFVAPEDLLAEAEKAVEGLELINAAGEPARLLIGGAAVTGSVFVDNARYREWLRAVWKADVTEMESAAIAQVCEVNNIPWLIVRGVSDLAGAQKGKNEENLYDRLASRNASSVLFAILSARSGSD